MLLMECLLLPSLQLQASFRQALQGSLPPDQRADCLFGLAECLQQLAERVTADVQCLPDGLLTQGAEAQANTQAGQLLMESVSVYKQVIATSGHRVQHLATWSSMC